MTFLSWKPEYAIGLEEVDHEHRQMIELINDLYVALDQDDDETLGQFIGDIAVLIGAHFALEERRMQQANYPEYQAHKQDHEKLLDEIYDLADAMHADAASGKEQLREQLSDWFGQHFKTFDSRLHRSLPH
jgi:hemerythrin